MEDLLCLDIDQELQLKQIEDSDANTLFQLIEKNRAFLRKYLNWIDGTISIEDTVQYINTCQQQADQAQSLTFLIMHQNKAIGSMAIYDWQKDTKTIHLGYWLDQDYNNKGIITACSKILIRYVFEDLQLEKIQLYFIPDNTASKKVAEKLGFKIEGYIRHSMLLNGSVKDQYIAGLLREEYLQQKPKW